MYGKKKRRFNWNEIMSMRCKVCNTSRITHSDQINSDAKWECQTCGNLLDANGYVVKVE